ncbi:MAG: NAD-binding protein [Limnochordaceae bacterium]|nr:NAD-binding protein [Limnochordaceae bacterium]
MHIAIAGAGYVGLTSAACFCELGHELRLVEIDPQWLKGDPNEALLAPSSILSHHPGRVG